MSSSTSSFRHIPWAFVLCLVLICGVEYAARRQFDGKLLSHEVDWMLYYLDRTPYQADYLLIGDSVGLQLSTDYYTTPGFAVLATNKAIEPTGQYFIVQRYLERNPLPKAVIFTARPFLDNNLDQIYTENFVLRTFTRCNEMLTILRAKRDLTMLAKGAAYRLLFSYRYKLRLQEELVGYTNANIYSGVDIHSPAATYRNFSFIKLFDRFKGHKDENTSTRHFRQLLTLLQDKGIDFYYIPAPIPNNDRGARKLYRQLLTNQAEAFEQQYPNARFMRDYEQYPKGMFRDGVHCTEQGMEPARRFMQRQIEKILQRYRKP